MKGILLCERDEVSILRFLSGREKELEVSFT